MTRGQFRMLDLCIRHMDETYRGWVTQQQEAQTDARRSSPRAANVR